MARMIPCCVCTTDMLKSSTCTELFCPPSTVVVLLSMPMSHAAKEFARIKLIMFTAVHEENTQTNIENRAVQRGAKEKNERKTHAIDNMGIV